MGEVKLTWHEILAMAAGEGDQEQFAAWKRWRNAEVQRRWKQDHLLAQVIFAGIEEKRAAEEEEKRKEQQRKKASDLADTSRSKEDQILSLLWDIREMLAEEKDRQAVKQYQEEALKEWPYAKALIGKEEKTVTQKDEEYRQLPKGSAEISQPSRWSRLKAFFHRGLK